MFQPTNVYVFSAVNFLKKDDIISLFTAQKMKFSIKDFFGKCDQIRSTLRIWSHLLKKSLMENFIFCAMFSPNLLRSVYRT